MLMTLMVSVTSRKGRRDYTDRATHFLKASYEVAQKFYFRHQRIMQKDVQINSALLHYLLVVLQSQYFDVQCAL